MQGAFFHQTSKTLFQSQASRLSPGQAGSVDHQTGKDELYQDKYSPLWQVLSVLANVVGGALLLSGMLILPHVIAGLLI